MAASLLSSYNLFCYISNGFSYNLFSYNLFSYNLFSYNCFSYNLFSYNLFSSPITYSLVTSSILFEPLNSLKTKANDMILTFKEKDQRQRQMLIEQQKAKLDAETKRQQEALLASLLVQVQSLSSSLLLL